MANDFSAGWTLHESPRRRSGLIVSSMTKGSGDRHHVGRSGEAALCRPTAARFGTSRPLVGRHGPCDEAGRDDVNTSVGR
jgi:hypothetical protein